MRGEEEEKRSSMRGKEVEWEAGEEEEEVRRRRR